MQKWLKEWIAAADPIVALAVSELIGRGKLPHSETQFVIGLSPNHVKVSSRADYPPYVSIEVGDPKVKVDKVLLHTNSKLKAILIAAEFARFVQ